ncbi:MAG: hypothetical protein AVDCRST_MAG79-152, partial [uncultured Thermoleophilia bacterium]
MPLIRRLVAALLLLLASPAAATAAQGPAAPREAALERTREELGRPAIPRGSASVPGARVTVDPTQTVASLSGQKILVSVELTRASAGERLEVTFPGLWTRRAESGLPYAEPAERVGGLAPEGRFARAGRRATLSLPGGDAGDTAAVSVQDVGIPAGTYSIAYRWRSASGATLEAGRLAVQFLPPAREAEPDEAEGRLMPPPSWSRAQALAGGEANATNRPGADSETFVTVAPGDSDRILVGANSTGTDAAYAGWVSNDGGDSFKRLVFPRSTDAPGEANPEVQDPCCDPISAADELGNLWYGTLTFGESATVPSRIAINRIAPGDDEFQPLSVGLPLPAGFPADALSDKPMMTIDDEPRSPTHGRLYVAWNDSRTTGNTIVVSFCDTRVGGASAAERCDNADNWSQPARVTAAADGSAANGSVIYADPAVGPDGRLHVVWWDFSSRNAIMGAVCDPGAGEDCASSAAYADRRPIARLDRTGDEPLPFACPIG